MINFIEIGLAFIEGLALIASPYILLILPLILSLSLSGESKRPLGVIIGFILFLSLFSLLSKKLIIASGVDLNFFKPISLLLLVGFACVLLSEYLSFQFHALTQKFATALNTGDGFDAGFLIGAFIALVWTPCANPIFASKLIQVIRQETESARILMIIAFSAGLGFPMFALVFALKQFLMKFHLLAQHGEAVRKVLGSIILCFVLLMSFHVV